nr:hypothetical protein [Desertimonas flava]
MSRRDEERFTDIIASDEAITTHLERGPLNDGLVFDAVSARLIEIGEAVRHRPATAPRRARHPGDVCPMLASQPGLNTAESSLDDVAAKFAAAAAALPDYG